MIIDDLVQTGSTLLECASVSMSVIMSVRERPMP